MNAASPCGVAPQAVRRTQELLLAAQALAHAASYDQTVSSATLIFSSGEVLHLTVQQARAMVAKAAPAEAVQ